MPRDRSTVELKTPHTQAVEVRAPNKLLVEEIKHMLLNHKRDPETWTTEHIAAIYDIDQSKIGKKKLCLYGSLVNCTYDLRICLLDTFHFREIIEQLRYATSVLPDQTLRNG